MNEKNFLIITGGTGGHVIPAVNFGNFIIDNGHKCYLLVDQRGLKYTNLFKGEKKIFSASHLSHNFIGNIRALISLMWGFVQSSKYIATIRPSLCVAFGSYASFMPLIVLCFFKIFSTTKIYLHEQNSVMGKVNRFFTPFVDKVFLNFEKTLNIKDRYKNKYYCVGQPINNKLKYKKRSTESSKISTKKIFICGGSQGAINLNKILLHLFNQIPRNILDQIQLSIQCPNNQINETKECLKKLAIQYELKSYFNNFIHKLYETDLLIARAGANTVNEVILTQTPTIFVPLPNSTNQHQFENASYLTKKNAAMLISEKDLNHNKTLLIIMKLINNSHQQVKIINNLQKIKNFNTNQLIFNYIK